MENFIVDSHCHLDFPDFANEIEQIVERAVANNINYMLTISTHIHRLENILAIAEQFTNVSCSVGTHPHHAEEEREITANDIITKSNNPNIVAIGETGLDFFYDNAPVEIQRQVFNNHIKAAQETGLPLIIHSREADIMMAEMLEEQMAIKPFTFVLHCFSSGPELAERALKIGGYISISGIITFKKAEQLQEIVKTIPLERLLVETDSPYLAPVPNRGKRNEPAFVIHTLNKVAELVKVEPKQLAKQTTENFFKLFNKIKLASQ